MIEVSLIGWLYLIVTVFTSSTTGLVLTNQIPWNTKAIEAGIPTAFGFALAPLLLGLASVLTLSIFPGDIYHIHKPFVFIVLLLPLFIQLLFYKKFKIRFTLHKKHIPYSKWEQLLVDLLILYVIVLLINSIFVPLIQNDALEYATVGRILFESKNIASYPAIHPEMTSMGFYGPWTHPPLYPALIYISYIFQGSIKFPGLMRFIAPWCVISCSFLIYKIGSLSNRLVGLSAAFFFISTPLLFLGADSALIDGLPVLGITLIIASIVGVNYASLKVAVLQGVILGLALWTHSEAILFIPLTIAMLFTKFGFSDFKRYLKHSFIVIICCLVIAAPPYLHNLKVFGAIVSDNPHVFAMPELAWGEYFKIARGIESWEELIQYGLLKGWFAIEAYSLTFWIMLISLIGFYWNFKENLHKRENKWLFPLIMYVQLYLIGTLLSIIVGIDLLVKNERYWLVLMPAVTLISGWGVRIFIENYDKNHDGFKRKLAGFLIVSIAFMYTLQLIVFSYYRLASNSIVSTIVTRNMDNSLSQYPAMSVIGFLKNSVPKNATVLSLRPADMYYASQKMISYLDPSLINFYKTKDKIVGWKLLKKLGIDYIHMTDYYLPPIYNSVLQSILADHNLTTLVYDSDGYQIYKLNKQPNSHDASVDVVNFSPNVLPWHKTYSLILGGRKGLDSILKSIIVDNKVENNSKNNLHFFQRDWATNLLPGTAYTDKGIPFMFPVISGEEYLVRLDLFGHALVSISMEQYDYQHQQVLGPLKRSGLKPRLGEFVLSDAHPNIHFARRFKVLPGVNYIRFSITHRGTSFLIINKAELIHLKSNN